MACYRNVLACFLVVLLAGQVVAQSEAERQIANFQVPGGMKVQLFAAEPLLANAVAFCFDEQGRVYVAETDRTKNGVSDNRFEKYWLHDDLAAQAVEDRLAYYQKWAAKGKHPMNWYTDHADQVRQVVDTDGDGKADKSTVFAGPFNQPLDGLGAGVIARDGKIYYTNIPHLWLLEDRNDDGKSEKPRSLSYGYGVRTSFYGHDLHGLAWGPDGRLYFSVGDRGYSIKTKEGQLLQDPGAGAVFRCEPDGSNLEVVHRGLRNPQELAFDQYGNLFVGDNNSDAGDKARLVYIVEGGSMGWNMSFQYMGGDYTRGPWHEEKIWYPQDKGHQPAWCLAPVEWVNSGPSGFVYYPGVGLPARYDNHFFLCDFRGGAGNSGIQSFAVEADGAGFNMVDHHMFWKKILGTDVDFGYDGKMYVSDWVNGWAATGKGRIYSLHDPKHVNDPAIAQMKKVFAQGFAKQNSQQLGKLLEHADMRVRQRAQFALVAKGDYQTLMNAALKATDQRARLHGIWGVEQVIRAGTLKISRNPIVLLRPLLKDKDAEVRAQAAKMLGDGRDKGAVSELIKALSDENARVRFFAAMSLGKLGDKKAAGPLTALLRKNNDHDVYLRHAAVMGLTRLGDPNVVFSYADDPSPAVRMGVLLVMRRYRDARIAQFLHDADEKLVTEAARAIHDLAIDKALGDLAGVIHRYADKKRADNMPLLRRVINANLRLGGGDEALAVATFAANADNAQKMRLEAIAALSSWTHPSPIDRVLGDWRPIKPRKASVVSSAVERMLGKILSSASGKVQTEATKLAGRLQIKTDPKTFARWVVDAGQPVQTRIAALQLLSDRKDGRIDELIDQALRDRQVELRAEARRLLAVRDPSRGVKELGKVLVSGQVAEQQAAFSTLGSMKDAAATQLLDQWMDKLRGNKVQVRAELQLDLYEAASKHPKLAQKLARFEQIRSKQPLGLDGMALQGGDANRGRRLFVDRVDVQCFRCHKVEGRGAGMAGPDLTAVGKKQPRQYILESIINPNAKISKGFETVVVSTKDGRDFVGTLKSETAKQLVIETTQPSDEDAFFDEGHGTKVEARRVTLAKSNIKSRKSGLSAMPQEITKPLSRSQLRDLVEFLFTNKPGTGKGG